MAGTPTTPADALGICNAALAKFGDDAISDFDEATDRASFCKRLYEPTLAKILGAANWSFATRRRQQLTQDGAWTPDANDRFRFRYQLPGDMLLLLRLHESSEYELREKHIYSNVNQEWADYLARVNESQWTQDFISVMVDAMAVVLAKPIGLDRGDRESMREDFQLSWNSVMARKSQEEPAVPAVHSPFIEAGF